MQQGAGNTGNCNRNNPYELQMIFFIISSIFVRNIRIFRTLNKQQNFLGFEFDGIRY